MTTTDTLLSDLADVLDRASKLAKDLSATLAGPSVDMLKPAYHPERMGYVCEIRCGDRVLFAGGWREVATWFEHANGVVTVTFTDPDTPSAAGWSATTAPPPNDTPASRRAT